MIKFENQQGKFEFNTVEELRKFLEPEEITDFDVTNLGYLVSNMWESNKNYKLIAFIQNGKKCFKELKEKGMNQMCKELGELK